MTEEQRVLLLGALLLMGVLSAFSVSMMPAGHVGLILRFGAPVQGRALYPGLYLRWPIIDKAWKIPFRPQVVKFHGDTYIHNVPFFYDGQYEYGPAWDDMGERPSYETILAAYNWIHTARGESRGSQVVAGELLHGADARKITGVVNKVIEVTTMKYTPEQVSENDAIRAEVEFKLRQIVSKRLRPWGVLASMDLATLQSPDMQSRVKVVRDQEARNLAELSKVQTLGRGYRQLVDELGGDEEKADFLIGLQTIREKEGSYNIFTGEGLGNVAAMLGMKNMASPKGGPRKPGSRRGRGSKWSNDD